MPGLLNSVEWLLVGLLGVGVVVWGPAEISDIAKAIGKLRKEMNNITNGLKQTVNDQIEMSIKSENDRLLDDQRLLDQAHNLQLNTDGKTREELMQEINSRINKNN